MTYDVFTTTVLSTTASESHHSPVQDKATTTTNIWLDDNISNKTPNSQYELSTPPITDEDRQHSLAANVTLQNTQGTTLPPCKETNHSIMFAFH